MKLILFFLSSLIFLVSALKSQDFSCPNQNESIVDEAKVLSIKELKSLNKKIKLLNEKIDIKLIIVLIDSTKGLKAENYTKKIKNECNLLQDAYNWEMLIFASVSDKKIRIECTELLYESFTATEAYDILDNTLNPSFIKKDYCKGLEAALTKIDKYLIDDYLKKSRKWYLVSSYDQLGLLIILIMTLIFNIFVYVKFISKPLDKFLLYQLLCHFLGTLNVFFYTVLVFKQMGSGIATYIFNILIVVLQMIVFIKIFDLYNLKRYLKAWSILLSILWLLAFLVISFLGYSEITGFESFLANIYYGFLLIFVILSVALLRLSGRSGNYKGTKFNNSGSGTASNTFGGGSSGGGGASGSW